MKKSKKEIDIGDYVIIQDSLLGDDLEELNDCHEVMGIFNKNLILVDGLSYKGHELDGKWYVDRCALTVVESPTSTGLNNDKLFAALRI